MKITEALKTYLTQVPRATRDILWIAAWDEKKTIAENCRALKIPSSTVGHNLCYKFKLGFREGFHSVVRTDRECLHILKKNGLSISEISRLFKVSHQRIGQLLKGKSNVKTVR